MLTRSDDLEILLTVVDSGGFSATAEHLDIQVARVSRSVSRIEQQLGVTILNRTTRRVDLTDEGRQFVESIRNGLQCLNQAEHDLICRGDLPKGRLRVNAASPFVFHQLIPLIHEFKEAYPDIELEITSNEGYVDLLEKHTDVAIRIGELADSTLHARLLGHSMLYVVATPEYLQKRDIPKQVCELNYHNLIGFSEPKVLNQWPLKGGYTAVPAMTCNSGETIRQLVLAGHGIGCLSGFMVNKDIEEGRLVTLLESEKLVNAGCRQVNAVYYKSSSVAKRISAFIDFIQPKLTL
ncbi:LysR family transcriptional regulator [Shewanella sp. UCD-FRSSP16_17]|uniref:LysR family transcriptional regulator n=1 Tax=Shewanella sp. UCD-FRSSP16_17 TaxID=1853256 RepID=UPI0007EEEC2A|nr:LysR family transcriptional regulator [Shewanella sp. UCD-FRSSP16_17]OBT05437.1 LysR family transcriptional regulator [Shewanella sp. UCD-FRSSP16_17]